jgi:hypothetical protein
LNLYLRSLNLTPMRAHCLAVGVRLAVPLQPGGRATGQLSKVRCYAPLQGGEVSRRAGRRGGPRRRDSHTNLNKLVATVSVFTDRGVFPWIYEPTVNSKWELAVAITLRLTRASIYPCLKAASFHPDPNEPPAPFRSSRC